MRESIKYLEKTMVNFYKTEICFRYPSNIIAMQRLSFKLYAIWVVRVKPQKIEINSAYFSLLNSNKTHHSNTHQMIKMWILKIDVFKTMQIPGGLFFGRKSSLLYLICSHKFWEINSVFSVITVFMISRERDRKDNFPINNNHQF